MITIARNIEILLLNHDLVMVPGFGGFLAEYKQAEVINDNDITFMPPTRHITFNKELNANDGLLVQAYMQYYDATFPQAMKQLKKDVDELNDELNENGYIILQNLGTLHKHIDGNIAFEEMHAAIVTPELFAMPTISVQTVRQLQQQEEVVEAMRQTNVFPAHDDHVKQNRSRRLKEIAISTAAAVALFFFFAAPYFKHPAQADKIIAGYAPTELMQETNNEPRYVDAEMIQQKAKTDVEKNVNVQDVAEENLKQETSPNEQTKIIVLQPGQDNRTLSPNDLQNTTPINNPNGQYTIVISGAANYQCAQMLIDQLNKQNIPGAFYQEGRDGKYVLYSRFATTDDAYKTINAMKQVSQHFQYAWVKKVY